MPVNLNVLPTPEPDEPDKQAEQPATEVPPTRKRRKKSEMIAEAVIPAADEAVEVKDAGTGAKVQRPWAEAVALVKAEKAEFTDRAHHYAMLKADQQEASSAFAQPAPEGQTSQEPTDETGMRVAPEEAALGDEVVVGNDTYVVGHGRRLVQGIVETDGEPIIPQRRWQHAAEDGPWESVPLITPTQQKAAEVKVETEKLPRTVERVDDGDGVLTWKIGNGILEKIGMPQIEQFASASQLQVGPITASRMVVDDGRRTVVPLGEGREGEVPTAVIEAFEVLDNTVEFIARRFRGQLQSFLEATGALKQPTS